MAKAKVVKNSLYEVLKKKETGSAKKDLAESIVIRPLEAYETIISTIQHELDTDSDIIAFLQSEMMEEQMEEMGGKVKNVKECESINAPIIASMPMPSPMGVMLYANLIATFPTFCVFEFGNNTYRVDYTYDSTTREVEFGDPLEVVLDVKITPSTETE